MLIHYMHLLNAGCPVSRHELTDEQWCDISSLKAEQSNYYNEKHKKEKTYGKNKTARVSNKGNR